MKIRLDLLGYGVADELTMVSPLPQNLLVRLSDKTHNDDFSRNI